MPRLDAAVDGCLALNRTIANRVTAALGASPVNDRPLAGGCLAQVSRVDLSDGRTVVVKHDMIQGTGPAESVATLADEAAMLRDLRALAPNIPVPEVYWSEPDLLVMAYLPGGANPGSTSDIHLADVVAELHAVRGSAFGYERRTPVGPLLRPNEWSTSWIDFFRKNRLTFLGHLADGAGRLPPGTLGRLGRLCERLGNWIPDNRKPSLIHGDLWGGNILAQGDRVTGLIDPAIFYADPELELAFMSLFGGPGSRFFARYREYHVLAPEFESTRRPIYQLEPLLAHAWFFGGGYGGRVDQILRRFVG